MIQGWKKELTEGQAVVGLTQLQRRFTLSSITSNGITPKITAVLKNLEFQRFEEFLN